MRVLVTGGAGFIGSSLVELLLSKDYRVRVLDNLYTGSRDYLPDHPDLEFVEGDVTDFATCRSSMEDVDGVFHLAAMSKVLPSLADPSMINFCTEQNVQGTANILMAALEHRDRIRKVIYSGSSTYYGANEVPDIEDMPHDCQTPYAVTKYVGELYCELFAKLHNLPTIRLRYFMTFGPREPSSGPYAIVTGVFRKRWEEGEKLVILGTGNQTRDFVHVSEVAEANLRAFECQATTATINVGSGKAVSILEIAELFSDQLDFQPPRVPDIPHSLADTTKCVKHLGWVPQIDVISHIKKEIRGLVRQNPGKYRKPKWLEEE